MDSYRFVPFFWSFTLKLTQFFNRKGLNSYETAWAVKKYKSHRRIPEAGEVRDALKALDLASKAT